MLETTEWGTDFHPCWQVQFNNSVLQVSYLLLKVIWSLDLFPIAVFLVSFCSLKSLTTSQGLNTQRVWHGTYTDASLHNYPWKQKLPWKYVIAYTSSLKCPLCVNISCIETRTYFLCFPLTTSQTACIISTFTYSNILPPGFSIVKCVAF